jgi:PAS domain S-box-containing protein
VSDPDRHPDVAVAPVATGLPTVVPDAGEALHGPVDPIHAAQRRWPCVVAIGGSAGSLVELRRFFAHASPTSGLAWIVVVHLAPTHESLLPEILQRQTAMHVRAALDGEPIEPNTVRVIPPGKHLTTLDDRLCLTDIPAEKGNRVAVDILFRALADSHGPHATAVVLSGTDGDGAVGLKRIKERGGLVVAQEPSDADSSGMPDSAIATGMVDWVLPVAEMPGRIEAYHAGEAALELPPETGPVPLGDDAAQARERQLREVLGTLRARTGHDFADYKRGTVVRRVARRLQVNGCRTLAEYLAVLETRPGEAELLQKDLLISVTNFFRDRDAFAAVESHVASLFDGKGPQDTVRVWCAACATGEEPYSMAMLLLEHAARLEAPPRLQVFGCDLDGDAIAAARTGLYPLTIAADVSEERLARFFVRDPRGWRVRGELRETVLFAQHDLIKDPPFSRNDLVSCRNLLIYLNGDARARAFETFHFALKPGGLLFLGASEAIEESNALFAPVDRGHRLYRRLVADRPAAGAARGAGAIGRVARLQERLRHSVATLPAPAGAAEPDPIEVAEPAESLHFRLLGRFGPASIVVDAGHRVVHLSEAAHRYLQLPSGAPTRDVLRLVHRSLRSDLRSALLRAEATGRPVEVRGHLAGDAPAAPVAMKVVPAADVAPGHFLVLFGAGLEGPEGPPEDRAEAVTRPDDALERLESALERTRGELRATVERQEVSIEELQSGNEELQAMNEELRSAGEELETSREELQSVNEELTTVNTEFRMRVEELARTNADLRNFMSAAQIATLFLDRERNITRFTPAAAPLFNLIPSDVGRPITDLKSRLEDPTLAADVDAVLRTLEPKVRELRDGERFYLSRILPYRTADDRIAGTVITFVDITDRRRAETALRESERQFRHLFDAMDEGYCILEMLGDGPRPVDWRYVEANPAFAKHSGIADAVGRTAREVVPGIEDAWFETFGRVVATGESLRFQRASPSLGRTFDLYVFRVGDPAERKVAALFTDVTGREREKRRQAYLLRLGDALRTDEDAGRMTASACRLLAEELGTDRAHVAEIDERKGLARVAHAFARPGLASLEGEHRIAGFGWSLEALRDGDALVVPDVAHAPIVPEGARDVLAAIGVGAHVDVPLLRAGTLVAALCVTQAAARAWTQEEVDLVGHTAERIRSATERVRAETALREAETRSRLAIDAARFGTWEWHLPSGGCVWNERHFELFGMGARPGPVEATAFFEHVHRDDRARIERELGTAVAERTPFDSQFRAVREGGEERWMSGFGRVVEERDGQPTLMSGVMFDITAHKRAELSLRESEARLFSVANVVPDLLWSSRADGSADWLNDRWSAYTGQRGADALGWGWLEAVHPDEREDFARDYRAAVEEHRPFAIELRLRGADGALRWHLLRAEPLPASEGAQARMVGAATDIHDLRRAGETLQVYDERLRAMAENLPGGAVFVVDPAMRYVLAGGEALQAAAMTPEALVGRTVREVVGPGLAASYQTNFAMALAGRTFQVEHAQGDRHYVTRGVPLRDAQGRVTGALAVSYDITDRKRAEDALRVSEERLRLIVENAREFAILAIDLGWRIATWNSGAAAIVGIETTEAIGRSADMLYVEEDIDSGAVEQERRRAIEGGRASDERWHRRRDGSRFWASGSLMSMHADGGAVIGFLKIFRDQTAELHATEALTHARDEAQAAGEAKDRFLAVLSHELRTPLTPVLMAAQIIGRERHLPEGLRRPLEIIERNVRLQTHLIDDLLDVTRIARGKMELQMQPVALHEVIASAVEVVGPEIESRSQVLVLELEAPRDRVLGDAHRLRQAVWNLLKNASKFTPERGTIVLTTRAAGAGIAVEIVDTGIGFEPSEAMRLFDPFEQENRGVTRAFGGLGLGLAIVASAIEGHGGTVAASSRGPGTGATFSVTLPLAPAES